MYSLIVSLIAYALAAWYLHIRLDEYLEPGLLRKVLVFLLASIVSWAVGAAIDRVFPAQAIHLLSAQAAAAPSAGAGVIGVKKT
ncbi:hypothetical protein GALL_307510 [mine drainage metagenome]|jgi:hypothetical protein|uniref:Uncharacterized protein n=1 Tax=mine drainage metagenome TaxID=410659 RepID=A0A1J5RGX8_9ZZZZ